MYLSHFVYYVCHHERHTNPREYHNRPRAFSKNINTIEFHILRAFTFRLTTYCIFWGVFHISHRDFIPRQNPQHKYSIHGSLAVRFRGCQLNIDEQDFGMRDRQLRSCHLRVEYMSGKHVFTRQCRRSETCFGHTKRCG